MGACLLYAVSSGLRSVFGMMLNTIAEETGIAYASVSFAIAVGQLVFGIAQPIFGLVSLKKSNRFVLILGCVLIGAGLAALPFCSAAWTMLLFFGILIPSGTGAVSFGIIMSALTPILGEEKSASASGFVNASSGLGSIVFSPVLQKAFDAAGFRSTMFGMALIPLALIPAVMLFRGGEKKEVQDRSDKTAFSSIKAALTDRNYLLLMAGFFTCGFHMAIIETHLYSQIVSYGIAEETAALAFSVYGAAAVAGSLVSGFLCGKIKMKWVAAALYGSRTVWIVLYLLLPKSVAATLAFAALLGLTGNATVPPVSGLTGKLFGADYIAALFGVVFVAHQIGSFFSAWLGGICVTMTGSYGLIWSVGAVLSLLAMLASGLIAEPSKDAGTTE